jgi:hypothetical protein
VALAAAVAAAVVAAVEESCLKDSPKTVCCADEIPAPYVHCQFGHVYIVVHKIHS